MLADRVGISLIGRSHESQDRLEATKLAISRWIERPERWGFVRRFEDPDLEAVFLDEYRRGGIRSIRAAIFATLLIFIAFALVASVSENNWYRAFADRLAAIAALSIFVTVLSLFSNFVVRFYIPVVASLVAISLLGVASSGKMVLDAVQNDVISPLGIIALVIVFAFMRLPAWVVLALSFGWVRFSLSGDHLLTNLPDAELRSTLYRVFTAFLGFVILTSAERRERRLFLERSLSEIARQELAEKTAEIVAASQEKSRLLAVIGHDLRQPLFAASLHLGLAMDLTMTGRVRLVRDEIGSARSALVMLEEMMSDLLASVRGDFVADALQLQPRPIAPLVDQVVKLVDPHTREMGLAVWLVHSRHPAWVLTHETALQRVLVNLLVNALKYSRPSLDGKPSVLVRVVMLDAACEVHVIDRGPGMDPAFGPESWQPYVRHASSSVRGEGVENAGSPEMPSANVGLGLYLVKRAVASMPGHTVRVASRPDRGTRFTIRLPLASSADAPALSAAA